MSPLTAFFRESTVITGKPHAIASSGEPDITPDKFSIFHDLISSFTKMYRLRIHNIWFYIVTKKEQESSIQ